MSLLFLGDTTYPFFGAINVNVEDKVFADKVCIANLESAIDPVGLKVRDELKYNLYSSLSVLSVLKRQNIKCVSLANNHSSDFIKGYQRTKELLEANEIGWFGTKSKPYSKVVVEEKEFYILGACSPTTDCKAVKDFSPSIYRPDLLLKIIEDLRERSPEAEIIIFVHWGYELARYPQPADREWARRAITAGARAVIGHHPHVVQGVELFKEGLIAYSLGNWMLPQVTYLGRRLTYRSNETEKQLGLELVNIDDDIEWIAHIFHYDKQQNRIDLKMSVRIAECFELDELTPFRGYTDFAYREYFKTLKENEGTPSGYPTFWSYSDSGLAAPMVKYSLIKLRKYMRRVAIKMGVHRPYNWA